MEIARTINYLENTQFKIRELVNNGLEGSYQELLKQVEEMNLFLTKEYHDKQELIDELDQQPTLDKASIFNQNQSELLSIGFLGALAPYILILVFALTLPLTIIFFLLRWHMKTQTIEQLRILDSHINRLIMTLKLNNG